MTTQFATIRESLQDCLAYCERLRTVPPPDQEAYRSGTSWYHGCDDWAALLTHPDALASIVRSRVLAEPALRYLSDDSRRCYRAAFRVEPWPDAASETVTFGRFIQARRQLLEGRAVGTVLSHEEVTRELVRPRALLLADWQASVWDGASAAVSAGFVDLHDVPGWDTWLALVELPDFASGDGPTHFCLVSWVPVWAAALVEEAIKFNPSRCLSWAAISTDGITAKGWGDRWNSNQA